MIKSSHKLSINYVNMNGPINSNSVVITGIGMVSSLGLDVVSSCAAARAGLSRADQIDYFSLLVPEIDPFTAVPVVAHCVPIFSDGFTGSGRLIRLGSEALLNLLHCTNPDPIESRFSSTGLFVNLSSGYYFDQAEIKERNSSEGDENIDKFEKNSAPFEMELRRKEYSSSLIPSMTYHCSLDIAERNQVVLFGDHSGVVELLDSAVGYLKRKELDQCIVGGIDSLVESDTLEVLHEFSILKSPDNPNGIMPGEAAAFLLLERYDFAIENRSNIYCSVESTSYTQEKLHRLSGEPNYGIGLSGVISGAISGLNDKGKSIGLLIGSLNGDSYFSNEWGGALLRLPEHFRNLPLWLPADPFGEIGAATAAVAVCVAIRAFVRDYAGTNKVLIWMSSPSGHKAAACIKKYVHKI